MVGGAVAEHLESAAALQDRQALGDQALKLDGADFRAVLLGLRAALAIFVGVKLALHALGLAMEQIGERPEKICKIGLEPRVRERLGKRVEHTGDDGLECVGLRQRTRIGIVLMRVIAGKLKLLERAGGGAAVGGIGIGRVKRTGVTCHGKVSG